MATHCYSHYSKDTKKITVLCNENQEESFSSSSSSKPKLRNQSSLAPLLRQQPFQSLQLLLLPLLPLLLLLLLSLFVPPVNCSTSLKHIYSKSPNSNTKPQIYANSNSNNNNNNNNNKNNNNNNNNNNRDTFASANINSQNTLTNPPHLHLLSENDESENEEDEIVLPDFSVDFDPCPGSYCGRLVALNTSSLSYYITRPQCGACPSGYRTNGYVCLPCTTSIPSYSWLYLGFMLGVSLLNQLASINTETTKYKLYVGSLLAESLLSFILALLSSEPFGKLTLTGCPVESVNDWYSMVHNPTIRYSVDIQCGQEAVYPLYTTVFKIYAFQLLLLLVIRIPLCYYIDKLWETPFFYFSLFFLPFCSVVHTIFAGLLYYAFPYISILYAFFATTYTMADAFQRPYGYRAGTTSYIIRTQVFSFDILAKLIPQAIVSGYGIISLIQYYDGFSGDPTGSIFAVLLCPLIPPVLFCLTELFTRPSRYRS